MPSLLPELFLFTDFKNSQQGEDSFVAETLSDSFHFQPVDIHNILEKVKATDRLVIRNNWPAVGAEESFLARIRQVYGELRARGVNSYNSLAAKGDMNGKTYLAALYRQSYPVIPTILDFAHLDQLPVQDQYVIKPVYGFSSYQLEIVSRADLPGKDMQGRVIQPFIDIAREIHLMFVDRDFIYAFAAQSRRENATPDDIGYYEPSDEELALAHRFVEWNGLTHGLQRIDIVRTTDGRLFLNEVEDQSPYLWIRAMPAKIQQRFFASLRTSLKNWVG